MNKRTLSKYLLETFKKLPGPKQANRYTMTLYRELAGLVLNEADWEGLTKYWYQSRHWSDPVYQSDQLFNWETAAISTAFPSAPAKVLIIAAGKGREMRALQKIGYKVYGIELDPEAHLFAQKTCAGPLLLGTLQASFADIATGKRKIPEHTFDAIIVGWGALIHLPGERVAQQLFHLLKTTFAELPILVSWPITSSSIPILRTYRKIRSLAPLPHCTMQRTIHRYFGPIIDMAGDTWEPLLISSGFETIYRGAPGNYPHLVIRSKHQRA